MEGHSAVLKNTALRFFITTDLPKIKFHVVMVSEQSWLIT